MASRPRTAPPMSSRPRAAWSACTAPIRRRSSCPRRRGSAGMTVADLERALYVDRSLVKHLAMRRTLFVFPRERLADAQAGASERVAGQERRRLMGFVEKVRPASQRRALAEEGVEPGRRGALGWPRDDVRRAARRGAAPRRRDRVRRRQVVGRPDADRAARADRAVRGRRRRPGHQRRRWTTSRPRWTAMSAWLGAPLEPRSEADGTAGLVEAWLRAFGPGPTPTSRGGSARR